MNSVQSFRLMIIENYIFFTQKLKMNDMILRENLGTCINIARTGEPIERVKLTFQASVLTGQCSALFCAAA